MESVKVSTQELEDAKRSLEIWKKYYDTETKILIKGGSKRKSRKNKR